MALAQGYKLTRRDGQLLRWQLMGDGGGAGAVVVTVRRRTLSEVREFLEEVEKR